MADQNISLLTLLFDGSSAKGAEVLLDGLKRSRPGTWAAWQALERNRIEAALEDNVAGGFDLKLGSILAEGWSDLAKLREATDPAQTPAGMSRSISLDGHEIEWSNKPKLEISIDGAKPIDVEFELVLRLDIDGVIVVIRDGRLREVRFDKYRSEAKVLCGGVIFYQHPLKEGRLPGRLAFADGVALGRSRYDHASAGASSQGTRINKHC